MTNIRTGNRMQRRYMITKRVLGYRLAKSELDRLLEEALALKASLVGASVAARVLAEGKRGEE